MLLVPFQSVLEARGYTGEQTIRAGVGKNRTSLPPAWMPGGERGRKGTKKEKKKKKKAKQSSSWVLHREQTPEAQILAADAEHRGASTRLLLCTERKHLRGGRLGPARSAAGRAPRVPETGAHLSWSHSPAPGRSPGGFRG